MQHSRLIGRAIWKSVARHKTVKKLLILQDAL